MALTLGTTQRTQPTVPPSLTPITSPILNALILPVAPIKPATSGTGPGVGYTPSLPLPTTASVPAAPIAAPTPTPNVPDVGYAPSIPLPAAATVAAPPIATPAPAPSVPDVSYAPSLIVPATIVPPVTLDTVAVIAAPTPIVAPIVTALALTTPPPSAPAPQRMAPPAQSGPAPAATPASTNAASSPAAAPPSLLDLYYSATQPTGAQALAGFSMPVPTIAASLTPLVRTGAEIIADAAYALVSGAQNDSAGIGMLLDNTGGQSSEDSNRRTPDAKKPSALAV